MSTLVSFDKAESVTPKKYSFLFDFFVNVVISLIYKLLTLKSMLAYWLTRVNFFDSRFSKFIRSSLNTSQPASTRLGNGYAIHLKAKRNVNHEYITSRGTLHPQNLLRSYAEMGSAVR
jgi:hypothetical protein